MTDRGEKKFPYSGPWSCYTIFLQENNSICKGHLHENFLPHFYMKVAPEEVV